MTCARVGFGMSYNFSDLGIVAKFCPNRNNLPNAFVRKRSPISVTINSFYNSDALTDLLTGICVSSVHIL